MQKTILIILTLLFLAPTGFARTFFVSPTGNDALSGLSIKEAWKTLDRVNQAEFAPGDALLLASGGVWYGQMHPRGAGEKGRPILLSSYGVGPRPVINIGAADGAAVRLVDQSWWEISNLEITSYAPAQLGVGRQGIVALYEKNSTPTEHIVIRNCYIHDVWGQMGGDSPTCGYNSAAIFVGRVLGRGSALSGQYDDVLIEDNLIERVDKCGIIVFGARNNVLVRRNTIENLGGDGIFVNGPTRGIIEYNVVKRSCMRSGHPDLPGGADFWPHTAAIWIQDCFETVMQFNAVYDTGRQPANGDGNAYDFDFNCKNCICQYNYSRNNHGFLLIMYNTFGNIARYNISENDQSHLIQMQGPIEERNIIHNNIFYVDYGTIDIDYFTGDGSKDKTKLGAYLRNNIFYATGQGRFRTVYTAGDPTVRQFDDSVKLPPPAPGTLFLRNCYFGPWTNGLPNDPEKLVADPLFEAPGSGGVGIGTLGGYRLKPGSPCINAGMLVALNAPRDFFGNPVDDGSPDIGAYEQIGSGVFADPAAQARLDRAYVADQDLAWARRNFPAALILPREGGKTTLALRDPLSRGISGSLTLNLPGTPPRPLVLTPEDPQREFSFVTRAIPTAVTARNKEVPSSAARTSPISVTRTAARGAALQGTETPELLVRLASAGLSEEWTIPVYYNGSYPLVQVPALTSDPAHKGWDGLAALEMARPDQVFAGRGAWTSPHDGSGRLRMALAGDHLLLFLEVTGSNAAHTPEAPNMAKVYLTALNAANPRMSRGAQIILPVPQNGGALPGARLVAGRREIPLPPGASSLFQRSENGYQITCSLPVKTLGIEELPLPGTALGVELFLTLSPASAGEKGPIRMSSTGIAEENFIPSAFNKFVMK